MNGLEQKQRGNAVARVEQRLDNVETVTEALNDRLAGLAQVALAAIDDERVAVLARHEIIDATATERWLLTGATQKRLFDRLATLEAPTTLWQRLRWLLTGRR